MLDILRQRRELATAIDVTDEEGRTPLMLAASRGFLKTVDYLVYYGANVAKKCHAGKTALDYAIAAHKDEVVQYFRDMNEADEDDSSAAAATDAAVDADGLSSTQRSRLKRKELAEAGKRAREAAMAAAAAQAAEDDDGSGGAGAGAGAGAGTGTGTGAGAGAGTFHFPVVLFLPCRA